MTSVEGIILSPARKAGNLLSEAGSSCQSLGMV